MKRRHLVASTLLAILCLIAAIAALAINGSGRSHAAGTGSQIAKLTNVAHSSAVVSGNVYYGTDSTSAYALNATTGKLIWRYPVTGPVNSLSLSLSNSRIYFATNTSAYALEASDGSLLWQFSSKTFVAPWSPAVVNGSMYLSDDYGVTALNADTGAVRWQFRSQSFVNPGIVKDGAAYFVGGDNAVHALNATTGFSLWHHALGNTGVVQTVANGAVYIITMRIYPTKDSIVYALHADDGSLLWQYDMLNTATGNDGSYLSVINGVVYTIADIGHGGFYLTALDASSGAVLWPHNTTYYVKSFQVVNGVFYLSDAANVYAFNARSGKVLWQYPGSLGQPGNIVVVNNVVYVATDSSGPTVALNAANGDVLWSYQSKDAGGNILVANGIAYTGGNYHVYALDGSTGKLIWSHYIAHSLISISMVVNGTLYVYSATTVDAFNASNGTELWHFPY